MYDQQTLFVKYDKRTQKVLNHNFRLKTQLLPWNNAKADLSFFYRYNENEIRNDQDTVIIIDRYNNKNYGVTFNINQTLNIFSLQLFSTYEKNSALAFAGYLSDSGNDLSIDHDYFSVGTIVSANLADGLFIPSVFYKHSNRSIISDKLNQDKNGSGIGIDFVAKPLTFLSFYAGYSINDQFETTDSKSFEIGSKFDNGMLLADVKFFSRNNFIPFSIRTSYNQSEPGNNSVKGFGALVSIKLWKLLFETNTSYYYDLIGSSSISLPEIQFTGGIYLNDYFFDENLLLKTGFKFYYTGELNSRLENSDIILVEPSNKIDFTLAGEIKKVAIVYFIWENLAGNNYFITPYYPMPQRNIRFGLSWELFN